MWEAYDDIHRSWGSWRDQGRCRIAMDTPAAHVAGLPAIVVPTRDKNAGRP